MTPALLTSFHWLYAGAGAGVDAGAGALTGVRSPVEKLDCLSPLCHPLRGQSDHRRAAGAPDPVNQLPESRKPKLKPAVTS